MKEKFSHNVEEVIDGIVRLSDYAVGLFPKLATKSSVKKAIKKALIFINGKAGTTGTHIKTGQKIDFFDYSNPNPKVFQLKFDIIYEDEFIALINKPAGFKVSGNEFRTIQNALLFNLKKSKEKDALNNPMPVHRLDNQTSGLLLIAKTHNAQINLGDQFENKHIIKKYSAVVIGKTRQKGKIIRQVNNKKAETNYKLIKTETSLRFGNLSLIELLPVTGRTHQLRIHCCESGFPILGDKLYQNKDYILKGKGLFLCSNYLEFKHPHNKEKHSFIIPNPAKFDKIIQREKRRYESVHLRN